MQKNHQLLVKFLKDGHANGFVLITLRNETISINRMTNCNIRNYNSTNIRMFPM